MSIRTLVAGGLALAVVSLSQPVAAQWHPTVEAKVWMKLVPKIEPGLAVDVGNASSIRAVNLTPIGDKSRRYRYGDECRLDGGRKAVVVGLYRDKRQSVVLLRLIDVPSVDFCACPRDTLFLMPLTDFKEMLNRRAQRQATEAAEKEIVRQILEGNSER